MTDPTPPIGDEELARLRGEVEYALRPEHRNSVVVFPLWDVASLLARLDAVTKERDDARSLLVPPGGSPPQFSVTEFPSPGPTYRYSVKDDAWLRVPDAPPPGPRA